MFVMHALGDANWHLELPLLQLQVITIRMQIYIFKPPFHFICIQ